MAICKDSSLSDNEENFIIRLSFWWLDSEQQNAMSTLKLYVIAFHRFPKAFNIPILS